MRNIDTDLLRAFLMIYETGSFSFAADKLGRTQSTISQQIKKLESLLGKDVFSRQRRSVELTPVGEMLLAYARKIVDLNDEIIGRISKSNVSGLVRLGAPEAFASNHLPNVLMQFSKAYPSVALEVNCELSHSLLEGYHKGIFDLVLFKRSSKHRGAGHRVWHESLIWVCSEKRKFLDNASVPLILSPYQCVYREKMINALEKKKMSWHGVFTSGSMNGRIAAAKAGMGVTAVPKELLSLNKGLIALSEDSGLPRLNAIEIAMMYDKQSTGDAATRLAEHIIFALENDPSLVSID